MTRTHRTRPLHLLQAAIAGALALVASAGHAQSNVTIYGLMDVYAEHRTHMAPDQSSRWLVNSGGLNTSRLGFRGSEDLGAGLKAIFQLESEVNMDTGQAAGGGAFWSRQANVGLDDKTFGKLVIGRSYSTTYDFILPFDPLNYAPNYSWVTSAGAAGGGATGGARKDGMVTGVSNMLKYSGSFGPVGVGGTLGLSEGTGNKVYAVAVNYKAGPVQAVATYDQTLALPGTGGRDRAVSEHLAVTWDVVEPLKLYGGVRFYDKNYAVAGAGGKHDKSRTYWVGALYKLNERIGLTAAYYQQNTKSGKLLNTIEDPSMLVLRARYSLSKRTDLYTVVGRALSKRGPVSLSRDDLAYAGNQTGVTAGIQHRF